MDTAELSSQFGVGGCGMRAERSFWSTAGGQLMPCSSRQDQVKVN